MSVGVLLVAHGKLGQVLLECMRDMIGTLPVAADVLAVSREQTPEELITRGTTMIERLDSGEGVLLLTDAFGSTPSNVANRLAAMHRAEVVSGVNLPMLVRVFNYPQSNLQDIARLAVEGGQRGVILCPRA